MNKKIYLAALALPLFVAACNSEDVLVDSQNNNQFEGVAQVDAKFGLDGVESRLATQWGIEAGKDILGFAWLGVDQGTPGTKKGVGIDGLAYQNHPLYAATSNAFQPETSIYVGKYYTYHPYDYSVKGIQAVNFTLAEQEIASFAVQGQEKDAAYEALAKRSIWISPKWTNVTLAGDLNGDDKAGVNETFNIYPRQFSNYANLFMKYINNNPVTGTPEIKSIKVSYLNEQGEEISVKGFAYAPTKEANESIALTSATDYWKNFTLIDGTYNATAGGRATTVPCSADGVTAEPGAITLTPAEEYLAEGEQGRVQYNALPAIAEVSEKTVVKIEIETTYGLITYPSDKTNIENNKKMTLDLVAKTRLEDGSWKNYCDGAKDEAGTVVGVDAKESFVQRLYKTGRFDVDVDFFDAVMDGMHVEDNEQLMKMLTFYKTYKTAAYEGGKYVEEGVDLYLDTDANGEFKISKKALALVQEINGENSTAKIALHPCNKSCGKTVTPKIVVFSEEDAEDADYKEVPAFNSIFGGNVDIYLDAQAWTWSKTAKLNSGKVMTIYNRGTLEITSTNIERTGVSNVFKGLENAAGATINVKSVANVKINLVNKGQINVEPNAELLAYGSTITNEATSLTAYGKIDNDGVIGTVENTDGVVNNYGYIHNDAAAKTYITANEYGTGEGNKADFKSAWAADNKIGTIELTDKFDNVSVKNATAEGFIKYTWDGASIYETPESEIYDVKYNYLIVKDNLKFNEEEKEIKFLEIANTGKEIILTAIENESEFVKQGLRGFVMQEGAKVNIMKGNKIEAKAAFIQNSRVYVGGTFTYTQLTSYLGGDTKDTDFIVIYE